MRDDLLRCGLWVSLLCATASAALALDSSVPTSRLSLDCFITNWMVVGPISTVAAESDEAVKAILARDHLDAIGGLSNVSFALNMLVPPAYGCVVTNLLSTVPGIDLDAALGQPDRVVAYCVAGVEVPEDTNVYLHVGSDDGVRVWIDDTLVVEAPRIRGYVPDEDWAEVQLARGTHRIVVKAQDSFGAWKFALRLVGLARHHELLAATIDERLCVQLCASTAEWELARVTLSTVPVLTGVPFRITGTWVSEDYAVTQAFESSPGAVLQIPENCALGALTRLAAVANGIPGVQPSVAMNLYLTPVAQAATARLARIESVLAALAASNGTARLARQHEGTLRFHFATLANETGTARCSTNVAMHAALTEIDRVLDALQQGIPVLSARRGTFLSAYISAIDGSAQPVRLTVPRIYRPELPMPLVMVLHDAGVAYSTRFPEAGDQAPFVTARVHARGTAGGYMGLAELDVLEALNFVTNAFSIDADRVYLVGSGMGGYGVWRLATHYPGVFAAVAVFNSYSAGVPLANLYNVATRIVHGASDMLVPVVFSRAAADTLAAQTCPVVYDELFGLGYHVHRQATDLRVFEWMLNRRRETAPHTVVVDSTYADVTQCHWLAIHARRDPRRRARARARFFGQGELIANFDNVALASADIRSENADPESLLSVVVNGRRTQLSAPLPPTVYFVHTSNGVLASRVPPRTVPGRRHYRPGSWQQFYGGMPVLIVRGTSGLPAVTNRIATCAAALARWSFVGRSMDTGGFQVKDDTDVTDDDMLTHNLILLGTPAQNEITAALASDLVTPLGAESLTVGDTNYAMARHGLWLTQSNPRAPQRLIWLWASPEPYFYNADAPWLQPWTFEAEDPPDLLFLELPTQTYVRATHFNTDWQLPTNHVNARPLSSCGSSVSDVVARIAHVLARGTRSGAAWLDNDFHALVASAWSLNVDEAMSILFRDSSLVQCRVDANAEARTLPFTAGSPDALTCVTTSQGLRSAAREFGDVLRDARYLTFEVRAYVRAALMHSDSRSTELP